MKKQFKQILTLALASILIGLFTVGCSAQAAKTSDTTATTAAATAAATTAAATTAAAETTAADTTAAGADEIYYTGEPVTLKALADITPHSELLNYIAPILEKQGITIEIVSTAADSTWNEKTENKEVDFNYFQHLPYLESENEANGYDLVSVGSIHVEPISAYSNKYTFVDQIPDDAKIVIPNDPTNEYRALKILEEAGFIKLDPAAEDSLQADITNITEYVKPVTITQIDSAQIIGHANHFDIYITNTNKALEAGVDTTKYLFRENADSPYGNIVVTRADRANDPAILAVVKALQSESTRAYIEATYKGAVVPAKIG
jgi:D-methionine transport system substrate-binding protein